MCELKDPRSQESVGVEQKLTDALKRLMKEDGDLLEIDGSERSISHRLALYLQESFEKWHVDCEYNRMLNEPKRLALKDILTQSGEEITIEDKEAKTVYPDIIIHHRGTDNNLLVVEMKKTTSKVSPDFDRAKLDAFVHQFDYRHAAFVVVATGSDAEIEQGYCIEWI